MRIRDPRRAVRRIALLLGTLALWVLATAPTGFPVLQLAVFAGPGVLLGVGMSWAAHASKREQWTWERARRSALIGGVAMPPLVGFFLGWMGTFGPNALVPAFTLGAWAVLLAGALVGALSARRQPRTPVAHLTAIASE